jgi:hypothetical protein
MTTSVDGRPARLNPLEDMDSAREMTWALRIQISEHIREGWHVVRQQGLADEDTQI